MDRAKKEEEKEKKKASGWRRIKHTIERVGSEEDTGITQERAFMRVKRAVLPFTQFVDRVASIDLESFDLRAISERPEEFVKYFLDYKHQAEMLGMQWRGKRFIKTKETVKREHFDVQKSRGKTTIGWENHVVDTDVPTATEAIRHSPTRGVSFADRIRAYHADWNFVYRELQHSSSQAEHSDLVLRLERLERGCNFSQHLTLEELRNPLTQEILNTIMHRIVVQEQMNPRMRTQIRDITA